MSKRPRIAILGFVLESNRFAPVVTRADFERVGYFEGQAILDEIRKPYPAIDESLTAFAKTMGESGDWEPAPVIFANGAAAGPCDHAFFLELMARMRAGLEAAMPLDGVYFAQHGAAITTEHHDPDGLMFQMARDVVGKGVPIIATLDLHSNISELMVSATSMLCGYITNPHVDMWDRGAEAARAMRELLAGVQYFPTFIRLPLVAPSVTMLTARGPYGDLINLGQARQKKENAIANVTIMGGFAWADTPDNGMAIVVTSRGSAEPGQSLARDLAKSCWADRERYQVRLTPLEEAIRMMKELNRDKQKPPLLFADVADNPGGGARGNTTWILKAAHDAGVEDTAITPFYDEELAAEAHKLGCGTRFHARFNRSETNEFSKSFEAEAIVRNLSDGVIVGRRGTGAGTTMNLGPTATLQVGGIRVVVISNRTQALDYGYFESFGVPVDQMRSLVVKSRGHFRAGFDHLFTPDRVIEVDCPGLVSPILSRYPWKGLPRPVYPMDPDAKWSAAD
ncbi:MAG: M81 family metallopeptidase [Alphaproteobacteria bacterium]|nr:M81 family metallopeptidase [Alphaproteobacteria bacterium]